MDYGLHAGREYTVFMQLRKNAWQIAGVSVNLALSVGMAKGWADRIPNWVVFSLFVLSLVPIAYWLFTHEKLLRHRALIREKYEEGPLRFVFASAFLVAPLVLSLPIGVIWLYGHVVLPWVTPPAPLVHAMPQAEGSKPATPEIYQHGLVAQLPEAKKSLPPPRTSIPKTPRANTEAGQIISAPQGIAIGGGVVTNPTVNNFAPPPKATRRISREAFVSLVASLAKVHGRVEINSYIGDVEASQFADDWKEVLKAAKWDVLYNGTIHQFYMSGPSWSGVLVRVHGDKVPDGTPMSFALDDPALALIEAARSLNFGLVAPDSDPSQPPDYVVLEVGPSRMPQ